MKAMQRFRSPRLAPFVAGLVVGLFSQALDAQAEAPGTFAESVEVDLVTVDVWVTDDEGNPVTGLERDQFSLLHDGSPVEVSHFREIRGGEQVDAAAAAPDLQSEAASVDRPGFPHLIVMFDVSHLTAESQRRLARELTDFLAEGSFPPEKVLIVRLEGGLFIEAPFGSSVEDLERALEGLEHREGSTADLATAAKQVTAALQGVWAELNSDAGSASLRSIVNQTTGPTASQGASAAGSGGVGAPGSAGVAPGLACDDFVDRVEPIIDSWTRRELDRTRSVLERLADASGFLSGVDGPKTLLYLSDGLGAVPGVAATSFVRGLCPAFKTDLEIDSLTATTNRLFEELSHRANGNRVSVHAIHAQGLAGSLRRVAGDASADTRGPRLFERSYRSNAREGLALLTEDTGGRVLEAGKDLGAALERFSAETTSYYSLAYTPPGSSETGYHTIDVTLRDKSLRPRHRHGYRDKTSDQWLTERLESALYLGLVDNPLSVRLGAGAVTPASDELLRVPLYVIVPADSLTFTPADSSPLSKVRIKVLALNAATRTLVVTDRNLFLPRPAEDAGGLIDMRVDVELEAGSQMLAVAIRDETSGVTSVVSTTLQIGS